MWIRSQGKFTLVNAIKSNVIRVCIVGVDELNMFESNKKKKKIEILCDERWILGTYDTEERALEVLNEIHKTIETFERRTMIAASSDLHTDGVCNQIYVYQMPEK